jgi:alanine racemase
LNTVKSISQMAHLQLSGVMTHFAMSDESDKTFANQQLSRFNECIGELRTQKILPSKSILLHACNSGGYLDLPKAHFDMVRMGILPLGVYPSQVCRRIPGLKPIMSFKTKIATVRKMEIGDAVGYGMHYRAEAPRTVAVLPMGYGTGFPRIRNKGHVLIHGKRANIIGGNAMNTIMVDITDIPETKTWDEVVVVGHQKEDEISVHDLASWDGTVSYEIMTRFSAKIPRIYIG